MNLEPGAYDELGQAMLGYAGLAQFATSVLLAGYMTSLISSNLALIAAAVLFVVGLILYGLGSSRRRPATPSVD
jgi:hypothetical protein